MYLSASISLRQTRLPVIALVITFVALGHVADAFPKEVEEQQLFVCRFIEVSPDNVRSWKEAVALKQSKFQFQPDSSQWGTWKIATGPRSGQFVRGFSTARNQLTHPTEPLYGINGSLSIAEADYWMKNVRPLQESSGNRQIWRPIPGLSSRGLKAGQSPRFWEHRRWRMKPGMYQRLEANYQLLIAAFDHLKRPVDFGIARLTDGGDFMIYAESTGYNNSADVPSVSEVAEAVDAVHGAGAWERFLKEHNAVMQENAEVENETWVYQQALSNLAVLPSDKEAHRLVEEHIDRVIHSFGERDIDALAEEYVSDAIRVLDSTPLPVQGISAVKSELKTKFSADAAKGAETLTGSILDARFLTGDTILAHGTFKVSDKNGGIVRQGKWGDVLKLENGHARFLLHSAYRTSLTLPTDLSALRMPEVSASGDVHFQRVSRSIDRFTSSFNIGDYETLADEFVEHGVRLVSGLPDVFVGRDSIRRSFGEEWSGEIDPASGVVLSASVLKVLPINNQYVIGAGIWRLKSPQGKLLDGGQWGNVFQVMGNEVRLLQECAGSGSLTRP